MSKSEQGDDHSEFLLGFLYPFCKRQVVDLIKSDLKTTNNMKFKLKKEIIFFTLTLIGYIGFYFGMVRLMDEEANTTSFNQTALVFFLVVYLIRLIFIIMDMLKED